MYMPKIHFLSNFLSCKNKTNHPISSNRHPSATANKAIHWLKWGGGVNKNLWEHHIITLTKYEVVHPTLVSENNSSSRMRTGLIKVKTVSILCTRNIFCWQIQEVSTIKQDVTSSINTTCRRQFIKYTVRRRQQGWRQQWRRHWTNIR